MLFSSLVLIYRRWSAMRALRRRRPVSDIWERLWIISAMVGDHRRSNRTKQYSLFSAIILISSPIIDRQCMRTRLNDRRKQTILFSAIWSPTNADIIHRRSHISQTSSQRRKALIADHRRYIRTIYLRTTLARFNFHFAKRKWREYAF